MNIKIASPMILLFVLTAFAQVPVKTLKVLTAAESHPSVLLPPAPPDGTAAQKKELAEEIELVRTRTPERFAQAKWDNEHEDATAFASVIGPKWDLDKLPVTGKLLTVVLNDQSVIASASKEYFHRAFPVFTGGAAIGNYKDFTCDADVRKPADRPLRSYPSGHGTMGYSLAVFLSGLMPERSQALLARAVDYGYSREICGDHYHSDLEASHALGTALGILLLKNTTLQPQIAAAKSELRAAGLTR